MIRWLRVVLPGLGWLTFFAVVYGAAVGAVRWLEWRVGGRLLDDARQPVLGIPLMMGAGAYAWWRETGYHPVFRSDYKDWLATVPWTSRKPLPLGPLHLVAQDVVIVGGVVLVAWLGGDTWAWHAPTLFLAGYLCLLACTLFLTGVWPWGYAVGFVLAATIYLWREPLFSFGAAALAYGIACLGLRRSLARFPWNVPWIEEFKGLMTSSGIQFQASPTQHSTQVLLGWPFGRLAPRFPGSGFQIPVHHAVLLGALVGSWVYAATSLIPDPRDRELALQLASPPILFVVLFTRWGIYRNGHPPPINFMGRLFTWRWIIPGYDQILVAPLLAVAAAATLEGVGRLLQLDPTLFRSVTVAVFLAIVLGVGPSLNEWRLTGNHRIVEGSLQAGAVKVG